VAKDERIEGILKFWFEAPGSDEDRPVGMELWRGDDPRVDRLIETRFGELVKQANAGELDAWGATPRGRLALILLLDQFNRNLHRNTPEAFTGDEKALALCFDGLDDEMDKKLSALERAFFYMPCMHAEDTDAQLASVEVYAELAEQAPPDAKKTCVTFLELANTRRDIVERFERFPQRNGILGRSSSPEESAFLQHSGTLI